MRTKILTLSLLTTTLLSAGGYQIPEVSTNALALSAATIAHAGIVLKATKFKGTGTQDGDNIVAKQERFVVPSLHYVSSKMAKFRFGMSVVVPGGLTKRWSDSPAKDSAEEFSLEVVEVNPTLSYLLLDNLSVAVGARALYSQGTVKSSSSASRDMQGDSFDYGYNLALAYKPMSNVEFGMTYRSNVDLSEEGNAKLYIGDAMVVLVSVCLCLQCLI